jgi:predicted nucleic acid-binding protein
MTFAYLDTSAAVKRYVSEPGSLRVRALLRRHDFLSSAITPVEITSALCRRKQNGDLSEENFRTVLRRIQNDRRQWELVEVGTMVLSRAEEIIQGSVPVKALDAIHIASLVTFQAAAGIRIPFITSDGKQRDAAAQMGLDIVWVG